VPAVFMLATTAASLWLLLRRFANPQTGDRTLFVADAVLMALALYVCLSWIASAWRQIRRASAA